MNFLKVSFQCYRQNKFSKLLWVVHCFEAIIRPYSNSVIFLKARFLQLSFKSISKASANGFYDLEPMTKQSHDLSKIPFFKKNEIFNFFLKKKSLQLSKCVFKASLKGFYNLELMIHAACILFEYQIGAIGGHCLKALM